MAKIDDVLADVESLVKAVKLDDAEGRLRSLLSTMDAGDLEECERDLRATISRFLPKRRRSLQSVLDRRLAGAPPIPGGDTADKTADIGKLDVELHQMLDELRDRHPFQWPLYNEWLSKS